MPNSIFNYTTENRGRVLLLFLLFLLAIYELVTAGFNSFAIICLLPFIILYIYIIFRWRMFTFWTLIVLNYFIQMKDITNSLPVPMSLPNEMLELVLLAIAIIDTRFEPQFHRASNFMGFAIMIWTGFCCIEVFNDSCNLGMNVGAWFSGFRLMAIQLVWILLVFSLYISTPQHLMTYLKLWALFSLFSAYWTYRQIYIGMTDAERIWMETRGRNTHILNAGTLIRYFSTFSDAANYGCHAAAAAVAFIIFGVTNKLKRAKVVYIFLSKSVKIAVPFSIVFAIFAFLLVFTKIGDGNQQIHRMRSAFDKNDASSNVRDINKEAIRKYIKDAPWGIGLGMSPDNVPANNKFRKLSTIPPDSEYVFIWVHTGPIGVTIFACCMVLIFIGGCMVVLFRLKNKTLIGIGSGFCCAFVAINLGGYANQVLYQYPNGLTFFGGMAIVFILPYLEPEWEEYEKKRIAQIEEKKRLKLEKKLASRV